jgi:hypothetical protein
MAWREDATIGKLRISHSLQGAVYNVPASGTGGYAPGALLLLKTPVLGQCPMWRNQGTLASCLFVPEGPVYGLGIVTGGHGPVSLGGDATEILYDKDVSIDDIAFVEHGLCDDNDQICGAVPGDGIITLTLTADPVATNKQYNYAVLRSKVTPTWDIFAAGTRACVTADGAAVDVVIADVLAGDIGMATYIATDDNDLVSDVIMSAGHMIITCDNDPDTDDTHAWNYVVLRKRGSFKPSHYVAYAGVHTTVGGDNTEVITITGALSTDIAICKWHTTDDTDAFEKAVLTADTLTVTLDADPSTTHKLAYMILRAY